MSYALPIEIRCPTCRSYDVERINAPSGCCALRFLCHACRYRFLVSVSSIRTFPDPYEYNPPTLTRQVLEQENLTPRKEEP